jgi:hypothetical protein
METFELVVRPDCYEVRCPGAKQALRFATVLGAFAYAQLSMSEDRGEMAVNVEGLEEHVPLYRMT